VSPHQPPCRAVIALLKPGALLGFLFLYLYAQFGVGLVVVVKLLVF